MSIAVALALVAGAILLYGHMLEQRGEARIMAMWQEDIAQRRAVEEATDRWYRAREEATRLENEETINAYKDQLAAADARVGSYERLLREARGEIRRRDAAEAAGAGGIADAPAAPGDGQLDALLAAVLAERDANDAQLAALIDVVKGQL